MTVGVETLGVERVGVKARATACRDDAEQADKHGCCSCGRTRCAGERVKVKHAIERGSGTLMGAGPLLLPVSKWSNTEGCDAQRSVLERNACSVKGVLMEHEVRAELRLG